MFIESSNISHMGKSTQSQIHKELFTFEGALNKCKFYDNLGKKKVN